MSDHSQTSTNPADSEKSFFRVIVHSFFIIPFLIAVFCALLFGAMSLLTHEAKSASDYLNDVKVGSAAKRWQSAFELSKIFSNPNNIPTDERFKAELVSAFEASLHDDERVRQYLAIAMGRTGNTEFIEPLTKEIQTEKEETLYSIIYSLGLLDDERSIKILEQFAEDSRARVRSTSLSSLGNIPSYLSKKYFIKGLNDQEANVQWVSAVSLAKRNDPSGKDVLLKLMDRSYLKQFPEVDEEEQTQLILTAITAAHYLNDPKLNEIMLQLASNDPNMFIRAKAKQPPQE